MLLQVDNNNFLNMNYAMNMVVATATPWAVTVTFQGVATPVSVYAGGVSAADSQAVASQLARYWQLNVPMISLAQARAGGFSVQSSETEQKIAQAEVAGATPEKQADAEVPEMASSETDDEAKKSSARRSSH